jgi:hypothetical protein
MTGFTLAFTPGSTGNRRAALALWAAYNLESALPADFATFTTNDTNPSQVMIDVPADGFAIAGVSMTDVVAGTTSSWTGLSQSYSMLVETSQFAGGSLTGGNPGPQTLTHSSTDTVTSQRMLAASFR